MPWKINTIDRDRVFEGEWPPIGSAYEASMPDLSKRDEYWLSDHYWENVYPRRGPWWVMLPMKDIHGELVPWPFCLDSPPSTDVHGSWAIIGELANVTVTPSIHAVGSYHGWITAGEVSDYAE